MKYEDAVASIREAAIEAAHNSPALVNDDSTRAAYARGVRAMACLVHACVKVAEEFADKHKDDTQAFAAFKGYANGLRHIVNAADDLVPMGWE